MDESKGKIRITKKKAWLPAPPGVMRITMDIPSLLDALGVQTEGNTATVFFDGDGIRKLTGPENRAVELLVCAKKHGSDEIQPGVR